VSKKLGLSNSNKLYRFYWCLGGGFGAHIDAYDGLMTGRNRRLRNERGRNLLCRFVPATVIS